MSEKTKLPPGQQLAAVEKWPTVGESTAQEPRGEWTVSLAGEVANEQSWNVEQLRRLPQTSMTIDIHCVTRWSKLGMQFSGVLLQDLLALAEPKSSAKYVSFTAYSERNHSTSLSLADAVALKTLVALECNGKAITALHGGPVRTIVPGRYFYKSLKWLKQIELLEEDRLGFWEASAGYHNHADPWQQQRFIAAGLTKQQMQKILEQRNFKGQDLLSFDAEGHDLQQLDAQDAVLRNANFRRCDLRDANFSGANLSNAHFQNADLRNVNFSAADLEGVNFAGANLRGTNFQGASLFGTSFFESNEAEENPSLIDTTTRFDENNLVVLTPVQLQFVRQCIE